ncbi:MAG TPA: hypothetical protein VIX61_02065, partial [Casimicrobiaceae bacterium]
MSSFRLVVSLAAAMLVTACQVTPPAPTPTPAPPAAPAPSPAPEPPARAVFTPVAFAEVPGWADDDIAATWPALLVGCRAHAANAKSQA